MVVGIASRCFAHSPPPPAPLQQAQAQGSNQPSQPGPPPGRVRRVLLQHPAHLAQEARHAEHQLYAPLLAHQRPDALQRVAQSLVGALSLRAASSHCQKVQLDGVHLQRGAGGGGGGDSVSSDVLLRV